jgi:transcriptional antiterminator
MASSFRERFLESLTDSACDIMKKEASGVPLSDNETMFIMTYLNELEKYETVPLSKKIMNGIKEVTDFVKENFGGVKNFFNSESNGIDDYVINTAVDTDITESIDVD